MKKDMTAIISEGLELSECVDSVALSQNTTRYQLGDNSRIEWEKVEQLHVLGVGRGTKNSDGPEKGCYVSGNGTYAVIVGPTNNQTSTIINRCGTRLRLLDMRFMDIEELELHARLDNLKTLRLSPMLKLRTIEGLPFLDKLESLDLSFTSISSQLGASVPTRLKRLEMAGNAQLSNFTWISRLLDIEELDLSGTSVAPELDLSVFHKLKRVRLVDTDKLQKVYGFRKSPNLEYIDLSCAGIERIPDDVRELKKLIHFDISNLKLDDLPDWLPELGLDFTYCDDGINLRGTTVPGVDMSLFSQKTNEQNFSKYQEMIKKWFEEREKEIDKPLNEVKVVFLGDGEAGKSHTIARLMNDGGEPVDYAGQSTPGVIIRDKMYDVEGQQVQVHFWDFGGQEIMHSMHRLFLTDRTVYVVLVNARDETQDDRARYWLHNIQSFAKDAPVILVLNKIDQNPNASVNEVDLRARYPELKEVVRLSALHANSDEFNYVLLSALMRQITEAGFLDTRFPAAWMRLKDKLAKLKADYITTNEYSKLCKACGVEEDEDTHKELLYWFGDLGFLFYMGGAPELEDVIVLNPNWITNALYIILFNKLEGARNGLIPHKSIYSLFKYADNNPDVRRTSPQAKYTASDIQYVLAVMRKFNLSFTDGNNNEFIPMLCQQNSAVDVQYYQKDPDVLEFNMEFDYLPNSLLHRLMVERHLELDMDRVWRTGACFQIRELGFSAVVVIDGDTLRFFIRHSDPMHRPNTYLNMLKANVDRIVKEMGLKAPTSQLIYKLDGKQETFNFDMLKAMIEMGQPQVFSIAWRRMIPIEDILNQSAPDGLGDERKLLDNIRRACMHIQDEPIYRLRKAENSTVYENAMGMEDMRNRRIRDDLLSMGYYIQDQSQHGRSGSGKRFGELDILLFNEKRQPWTAIEALRISDGTKAEWNKHLDKLISTYNYFGARFLYLLTYVDADPKNFTRIWKSYQSHIPAYNPAQYTCARDFFVELNDAHSPQYIKVAKCQYSLDEVPITVYHIFARIPTQDE